MTRELIATVDAATAAAAAEREVLALRPRSIALGGGSTPRELYERLAKAKVPWVEIDVFFGDERCVPPDHPDSNFRLAHEALLSKVPARVHRMRGERCDAGGYAEVLRRVLDGDPPALDLAILGLGDDGHTASLFPGDPALEERNRTVVRVDRPDRPRLTLTLPVLSAAKVALFLVTGASKRDALRRLLAGEPVPAARVAAARVVVVADEAAIGPNPPAH